MWSDGARNHFGTTPWIRCMCFIAYENNCKLFLNFFPSYHGKGDADSEGSVGKGCYMRVVKACKLNWGNTRLYGRRDVNRRSKIIRDALNVEFTRLNDKNVNTNGILRYAYVLQTHHISYADSPYVTITRFSHHKQFYFDPNDRNTVKYRFLTCVCNECMLCNMTDCTNKDIVGDVWKEWHFPSKLINGRNDFPYRPLRGRHYW